MINDEIPIQHLRQGYMPVFFPSSKRRFLNRLLNWIERRRAKDES